MSSLIFVTNEDSAIIATDTLAVSNETNALSAFTSKAIIVPHLRMVIAGTGVMGFTTRWFARVNDNMVVKDIDHLDVHTPKALQNLWVNYLKEFSIPPDIATTTVYHFGFSKEEDVIHSYVYRSENDFTSEAITYGMRLKPEADPQEGETLLEHIKLTMNSQRSIQATKPENERLYIGGEIQIITLSKNGFNAFTLDKFDDYHSDEEQIYANFNQAI